MDFLCASKFVPALIAFVSIWQILPTALALSPPTTASNHHAWTHTSKWRRAKEHNAVPLNLELDNIERGVNSDECNNEGDKVGDDSLLTTAILTCAYDGTYFRGWTAGNSESKQKAHVTTKGNVKDNKGDNKAQGSQPPEKPRQSRRSRTLQRKGGGYRKGDGRVRTVDDTIRSTLAKVYGNVNPNQIKIECCSRTDAGVHATSLIAQFYCTKSSNYSAQSQPMPMRPNSHDDTSFLPLPFHSDLSKLVFVLNRMLPPDVRVVAASPLPSVPSQSIPIKGISNPSNTSVGDGTIAFHPTLHTVSKTYTYQFAIGHVHDPLHTQYVWHLDGSSNRAVGMNGKRFCLERALQAANLFVDSKDDKSMNKETSNPRDYGAFRSAFRGTDRGRVQSTICKLWRCEILQEKTELLPSWETTDASRKSDAVDNMEMHRRYGTRLGNAATDSRVESFGFNESPQRFTVVITGDRFLYKMIRNIVGTIVAVGCGNLELDDVRIALDTGKWGGNKGSDEEEKIGEEKTSKEIISASSPKPDSKTQTIRRICAPARGLTLVEVNYPAEVSFDWRNG